MDPIDIKINVHSDYDPSGVQAARLDALSLQQAYENVPTVSDPKPDNQQARQLLSSALAQAIDATRPENQPVPDLHPADLIDSDVLRALAKHNPHPPLRSEVANAIYKRAFDQGRQAQDLDVEDLLKLLDPLDEGAAVGLAADAWDRGNKERCTILPFGPDKLAELQKQAVDEFLGRHSQPDPFDDALPADGDASPSPFAPADEFSRRRLLDQWGDDAERISDDLDACADAVEESTGAASITAQELQNAADSSAQIPAHLDTCYQSVPLVSQALDAVAVASEQAAVVAGEQLDDSMDARDAQAVSSRAQAAANEAVAQCREQEAKRQEEWSEVSRRSLDEQEAWLRTQLSQVQEGSDLWKKYNSQLRQVNASQISKELSQLGETYKVTGNYALKDSRTQAQIYRDDEKALHERRAALLRMIAAAGDDARLQEQLGKQLKETDKQIAGLKQTMHQGAKAARKWLKELEPPKLKAKNKMVQRNLDNLSKGYKKAAARAAKAAEKGDAKALDRAKRSMDTYAKSMKRLAAKPGAAEKLHKDALNHLDLARRGAADSGKAAKKNAAAAKKTADSQAAAAKDEKRNAAAAKKKAAANEQAAAAAKKSIPKAQSTEAKIAGLNAQVKDLQKEMQKLAEETAKLSASIAALGTHAAQAAAATATAANAAAAADKKLAKQIESCMKAINRLKR